MKYFITGGSGFIGSNLVDRLLKNGDKVTVYDNFSTGKIQFLDEYAKYQKNCSIINGDLLDTTKLLASMSGHDFVFHLAANADVRNGPDHTDKDLKQNTIATYNVLEAMRLNNISKIAFSSTGSIYGEPTEFPTPETAKFPIQTSLYGASKLACEGLIQAYGEAFNMQSWIFRFVSILGERYSHGHIKDFLYQLKEHPHKLNVLGDGKQKKSYLYVNDCLDGMLCAISNSNDKINIFNLGHTSTLTVNQSIGIICNMLDVHPHIHYSGGRQGWVGDSPYILLDTTKINSLDWKPKLSLPESVHKTVKYLEENEWILK